MYGATQRNYEPRAERRSMVLYSRECAAFPRHSDPLFICSTCQERSGPAALIDNAYNAKQNHSYTTDFIAHGIYREGRRRAVKYRLDLETVLRVLRQRTGRLESRTAHIANMKGDYYVFIRLVQGSVTECAIFASNETKLLSGGGAFKRIENQILEWLYTQEVSGEPVYASGTSHHPLTQISTPELLYRARIISQQAFLTWPRPYRSIYFLTRDLTTIEHIVTLLSHNQQESSDQVLEMIAALLRGESALPAGGGAAWYP